MNFTQNLYIISLFIIIGVGVSICVCQAIPYFQIHHKTIYAYKQALSKEVGTYFYFKFKTNDFFVANNPIDIEIRTSALDTQTITGIQLGFINSGYDPFFEVDIYDEDYVEKISEAYKNQIVHLKKGGLTWYKGELNNVTYYTGGKYDVGITIWNNSTVMGHGVGDTNYILKDIIEIAPPETLIQYRNNEITLGIAWAAFGITLILFGLTHLLGILEKIIFNL